MSDRDGDASGPAGAGGAGTDSTHRDTEPLGHPALTDALTGLPNLLHFHAVYRILFETGDRGFPLVLLLLQLRDAEQEGLPPEGTLREAGALLGRLTRKTDLVAHLGDGRFASLLVNCNLHGARIAADRIVDGLAEIPPPTRAAIGMAPYRDGIPGRDALIATAEGALSDAWADPHDPVRSAE